MNDTSRPAYRGGSERAHWRRAVCIQWGGVGLSVNDTGRREIRLTQPDERVSMTRAGGSISVSNLGMYDISEFIAVLNPPQVR